jgi:thiol-disulfide isomerase/thioredoxin
MNIIIKNNENKNKNENNNKTQLFKNIYGLDKGIIELTLKDFIKKKKKILINNNYFEEKKGFIIFYAPWCKHCLKLSDLLIELALSNINLFYFGSVNIENIEDGNDYLAVYANIKKLPMIKYIDNDSSLKDYTYKYNADNLIFYMNSKIY